MLPPARLFPENGHVVMRSDWTRRRDLRPVPLRAVRRDRRGLGPQQRRQPALHHRQAGHPRRRHGGRALAEQRRTGLCRLARSHGEDLPHMTRIRPTDDRPQLDHGRQRAPRAARLAGTPCWRRVRGGGQSPIQDKSWWKLWGLPRAQGGRPALPGRPDRRLRDLAPLRLRGRRRHALLPAHPREVHHPPVRLPPSGHVRHLRPRGQRRGRAGDQVAAALALRAGVRRQDDARPSLPPEKQLVLTPDGKHDACPIPSRAAGSCTAGATPSSSTTSGRA